MIIGKFSERSFPCEADDLARLDHAAFSGKALTTRAWLRTAHETLGRMLPEGPPALLNEDLLGPDGRPIDVFRHSGVDGRRLASLRHNWNGLSHTAQAAGTPTAEENPTPSWTGFADTWIPVANGIDICGRLGWAAGDDGGPRDADCLVLLPGLLGTNNVLRTRDLAAALRSGGYHVLALELRGHGETHRGRPDLFYTFGAPETADLLAVSRWLESHPHVRRTGLIGFCWGANHALLAAWFDNRPPTHLSITDRLAPFLPPPTAGRHYRAGVIAFSPVLRFEELMDLLDRPWSKFKNPAFFGLQRSIERRMQRRGYPDPDGSLRRVIQAEFDRSALNYPEGVADSCRFLRLLPYRNEPDGGKLEDVRIPTLIVHAANDPLAPAQDVADLMALVRNPRVAMAVLPGGGHVGFAPYAKRYYYSLILNYFDSRCGAAACMGD